MLKRRIASPADTERENECPWKKVGWRAAYLNLWIGFCYWEGDKGEVGRERGREGKDGIMLKKQQHLTLTFNMVFNAGSFSSSFIPPPVFERLRK